MKRLYDSIVWKRLRRMKLNLNPVCELCLKANRFVTASHVDHIESIESGGEPLSMDNLMSLCHPCHSRKTVLRDGGLGKEASDQLLIKGCGANGMPLDPNHPWNTRQSDCE